MIKFKLALGFWWILSITAFAQVGINTPTPQAAWILMEI